MKKKLLAVLCVFALFTGICACGQETIDYKALKEKIDTESIKEDSEKINRKVEEKLSEVKAQVKEDLKEAAGEDISEIKKSAEESMQTEESLLKSTADIELTDLTGKGTDYNFIYDGEFFEAKYTEDNWKILDSYKINNEADMTIICQALIEEHPIHGIDLISYRTPEDMAYEWLQHNLAYALLSEGTLKNKAKDVDLNPEDQGKSFEDLYKDRTGKDLTLEEIMKHLQDN